MTIKTANDNQIIRFIIQIAVGAIVCFGMIYALFLMGGTP